MSPRSTLPVLSNVLLEAHDDTLRLTATNLDLAITATMAAQVIDEGRTTVGAKLLSDYVSSLPEAPCTMALDRGTETVHFTCGSTKTNLHGIDAAEFPPLPLAERDGAITVSADLFDNAVSQTAMAASVDEASPVLTGVLFQVDGSRLTLAATDRHRLAVKNLDISGAATNGPTTPVIVPSRHLNEVARAINPSRATVTISYSAQRNHIFFNLGDVEISSRLIEGNYPNYTQVIPAESTTTVSLPTDMLLRGTRTASVLARDAANPVRLQVADSTLTLIAQTAEVGDHEAPLDAAVNGDDLRIAFNAKYMLDALNVLDADQVELSFNGALQPGVIRPVGRDDYLCIIMPVKVP